MAFFCVTSVAIMNRFNNHSWWQWQWKKWVSWNWVTVFTLQWWWQQKQLGFLVLSVAVASAVWTNLYPSWQRIGKTTLFNRFFRTRLKQKNNKTSYPVVDQHDVSQDFGRIALYFNTLCVKIWFVSERLNQTLKDAPFACGHHNMFY